MRVYPIQVVDKRFIWEEQKEMLRRSPVDISLDWSSTRFGDEEYAALLDALNAASEHPSNPIELTLESLSPLAKRCQTHVEALWSQEIPDLPRVGVVTNEGYTKLSRDAEWSGLSITPELGELMSNSYPPPVFVAFEMGTIVIAQQNRRFHFGRTVTPHYYPWDTARLEVMLIDSYTAVLLAQLRHEWKENRKSGLSGLTEESCDALDALTIALAHRTKERLCQEHFPEWGFYVVCDRMRDLNTPLKRRVYRMVRGLEQHLPYTDLALYDAVTFDQKPDKKGRMQVTLTFNADLGSYISRTGE